MVADRRLWLVIGCGSIGMRHMRNLLELDAGEIVAFDTDETRRNEAARDLPVRSVASLDEAWALRPDAAVIATPTSLHASLAIEAAKRGAHMLIEKPLSHSLDGIDELADLVEQQQLSTLVGCNLRFHPGPARVKELIDTGSIGTVLGARVEVGQYLPDWHPEQDYRRSYSARRDLGGGVILDAIHEIDCIRWMLGEIVEVACLTGDTGGLEIETEDLAAIVARFTSGAIGEIHMDYLQRSYSRSCQVIGELGTIRWEWSGSVRLQPASGREQTFEMPAGWEPNRMYLDELAHFIGCLDGGDRPALDVRQAAEVLRVALAAKQSASSKQFVNPSEVV